METHRFTIVLSSKFEKLLNEVIRRDDITRAEAIRRSVAVYAYLSQEVGKGNTKLQLVDESNKLIKEIILPATMIAR